MIITKDQESYLDAAVGSSDKDAFMQSETAQMLQDAGADPNASYELDLPPPDEPDDNEILEIDMLNPKHAEGQKFNFMSKIVHDHHYGVGDYAKAGDENGPSLTTFLRKWQWRPLACWRCTRNFLLAHGLARKGC